jgi:hypothetical protein
LFSLQDIDPETFGFLLDTRDIDVPALPNPLPLFEMSLVLQFDFEKAACEKHIKNSWLTEKTALAVMLTSDKLGLTDMYRLSRGVALYNFSKVKYTNNFVELSFDQMFNYLDDPHLNTKGELEVFDAMLKWISYDYNNRLDACIDMIQSIR